MVKSAGLVVIKNKKILLCHPIKASWFGSHGIPKGHIEENETALQAAIRETKEEAGLLIDEKYIDKTEYCINYDKKGKVYKQVFYFIANVNDSDYPDILDKEQLQLSEVDYGEFFSLEEAEKRIFWRLKPILKHIK